MTGSSIGKISYWNDINAYQPNGTTQNGLIFDLKTSDGGSWKNLTTSQQFTKARELLPHINIRPNCDRYSLY